MKRIVILVITYNQEDVIRRALDSVLSQKDWGLYRIVVSDDCSKDHTWDILQEYYKQYPDIMDIHRNEHNLGIYNNLAQAEKYLHDYDLFGSLAGDDEYCEGYFESVQKLIIEKKIDTTDAVGIYSDWMSVSPSGEEHIYKQDAILTGHKLWSLKARGKISGRSLLMTKRVRDAFAPLLEGKGLNLKESNYDAQSPLNIKKAYYLPKVTSKYYTGIGVSKKLNVKESDYLTTQCIEKWNYAIEHYVKTPCDMYYARFEIIRAKYYMTPSFVGYFKMIYFYSKGELPKCRNTFKSSAVMFLSLAKYGLTYKSDI